MYKSVGLDVELSGLKRSQRKRWRTAFRITGVAVYKICEKQIQDVRQKVN